MVIRHSGLSHEESGPLERYLDTVAERRRDPASPAAVRAWEEALSELCGWATDAFLVPVMTGIAKRLAQAGNPRQGRPGPPRIVLVPCGRLGIAPWHAARLPPGAPCAYACQAMVISYAASGRQFLDTVRRTRRAPDADAVLVADHSMTLTHADLEVTALLEGCYPRARLYGELYEPPVGPEAPGTPGELLDVLDGAPCLLHVACHGSAGTNPTDSALDLAEPPPEGDEPGARVPPGRLTVARLLDRQFPVQGAEQGAEQGPEQTADEGPLVVLSACETDLTNRDHDEALTLTTAFLARGACDVVGSRWATQDSTAALLMAVFHHYLSVEGRSPVDALRSAQTWMLDPDRRNPGSLSSRLLDELNKRPRLDHPADWAAFIHQGHPGPATARGEICG